MGIVASASGKSNWVNCPAGTHNGIVCDVIDLGEVENKAYGKMQHKCLVSFQVDKRMEPSEAEIEKGRMEGRRFIVSKRFTVSLSDQSHLLPFVETLIGRRLNKDEKKGFDLDDLIGIKAMVQVVHDEDENDANTVYANIQAALPVENGMVIEDYIRKQDREEEGNATNPPRVPQAPPRSQSGGGQVSEGFLLQKEQARWGTMQRLAAQHGIPLKELPEAVTTNLERLKKINDTVQARVKEAEAANAAAPVEDDEDFDPLAVETPAAPAKPTTTKEAGDQVIAHRKETEAAHLPAEEPDTNPFEDEAPAAPTGAATSAAVDEDTAFAKATEVTANLTSTHTQIAYELVKRGVDVDNFNTDADILAEVNAFRATTNKKAVDAMDKLTPAAANAVLKAVQDGAITIVQ